MKSADGLQLRSWFHPVAFFDHFGLVIEALIYLGCPMFLFFIRSLHVFSRRHLLTEIMVAVETAKIEIVVALVETRLSIQLV